jgi:hypothetical protein
MEFFLEHLPKLAVRINRELVESDARDWFHRMLAEIGMLSKRPTIDYYTIVFAYGAGAVTALLLGADDKNTRDSCIETLGDISALKTDKRWPEDIQGRVRHFFLGLISTTVLQDVSQDIIRSPAHARTRDRAAGGGARGPGAHRSWRWR